MVGLIFVIIVVVYIISVRKIPPGKKAYVRDLSTKSLIRMVDGGRLGATIFINPFSEYMEIDGKINGRSPTPSSDTTSSFNFLVATADRRNYIASLTIAYRLDGPTDMTTAQIVGILRSDVTKYTKKYIEQIPEPVLRTQIYSVPNQIVKEVNTRLVKYNFKLTSVRIALNKPGANRTLNNDASNDGISDDYTTNRAKPNCVHEDPGYVSKAQKYKESGAIQYDNYIDKDDDGITVFGSDNSDNPIKESISLTSITKNTIESDYNDDDDDPIKNL